MDTNPPNLLYRIVLFAVSGIFLAAFLIILFMPREVVIVKGDPPLTGIVNATGTVTETTGTIAAVPVNIPIPSEPKIASASATPMIIVPLTPIDTAAYDAKILSLANIPPPKIVSSTATSTAVIKPSLWPVKSAPYPNAGALLPFNRIVAYYGNLYSKGMGVLGQYEPPLMLAKLASTTAEWQAADPSTNVIPALDYIAVVAQGSAGVDGKYRARMPASEVNKVLDLAAKIHGIVILDVQVGLSNVRTEIPFLAPYLKFPQVHLALDPEFAVHGDERPGEVIGTMTASEVNYAAQYLDKIVKENDLPPKILIVHRFTRAMLTGSKNIEPLPNVQIIEDMDGFGNPPKKLDTYNGIVAVQPVQFTGFKLFYKNDVVAGHLMTPTEVLELSPQPSFIQYQ